MMADPVRGHSDPVWWRVTGLALLALTVGLFAAPGGVARGQEAGSGGAPEDRLAQRLIEGIPPQERIALYPLWGESQDIPKEDAKSLYDRILAAIYRASAGRHGVFGRNQDDAIWEAWQREHEDSDYRTLWKSRKVGVVVRCQDRPHDLGIHLSCTALSVGAGELESDVPASEIFPVSRSAFRFDYALNRLIRRLAEGLFKRLGDRWPGRIAGAYVIHRDTGQRSRLGGILEEHLSAGVNRKIDARRVRLEREARGRAVLQSDEDRPAEGSGYRLCGGVQPWSDSTMRLQVRLTGGGCESSAAPEENEVLSRASEDIEWAWLPSGIVGDAGARRFRAEARAELSAKLDEGGAKRAMRNLARARVVAQALGVAAPSMDVIRTEAEGVRALTGTLDHGIPVDESFSGPWPDGSNGLKLELTARVVKIGAAVRPRFRASLEKSELRENEPVRIGLSADEAVHAAVFAWGADNRVVRLYPNPNAPDVKLEAGRHVVLPRAGEGYIWSAPMPGNAEDHEAFIVLAASERLAFEKLTRRADDSVEKTIRAGVPATSFFAALAKLDTSRLALSVLAYRVTR